MEVDEALDVLGVAPSADWHDVRSAYRELLMAHHPDAAGDAADSAERTERIVAAFRCLRSLTDDGTRPLPLSTRFDPTDPDAPMILHARPGDVFARMCEAAEQIGHLSYADRDASLLQVTIGDSENWAPAQLTAELTAQGEVTMAMFSLEALGTASAPPIGDVVARLAEELRAPATLER